MASCSPALVGAGPLPSPCLWCCNSSFTHAVTAPAAQLRQRTAARWTLGRPPSLHASRLTSARTCCGGQPPWPILWSLRPAKSRLGTSGASIAAAEKLAGTDLPSLHLSIPAAGKERRDGMRGHVARQVSLARLWPGRTTQSWWLAGTWTRDRGRATGSRPCCCRGSQETRRASCSLETVGGSHSAPGTGRMRAATVLRPSHRASCGQDPLIDNLGGPDKVVDVQSLGSSPRGARATAPIIKGRVAPAWSVAGETSVRLPDPTASV